MCEYHHINQRGQHWKWESKRSKVKSQNLSRLPSSSSSLHQWSNLSHPSCPHSVTTSSAQTLQQHGFREWSTVFKSNWHEQHERKRGVLWWLDMDWFLARRACWVRALFMNVSWRYRPSPLVQSHKNKQACNSIKLALDPALRSSSHPVTYRYLPGRQGGHGLMTGCPIQPLSISGHSHFVVCWLIPTWPLVHVVSVVFPCCAFGVLEPGDTYPASIGQIDIPHHRDRFLVHILMMHTFRW